MKILLICTILINSHVFTQSIDIEWQTTIGGNLTDIPSDIFSMESGNLIHIGYSESGISGNKSSENFGEADLWVVKTNSEGAIIWDKSFGGSSNDGGLASGILFEDKIFILTSSESIPSGNKSANSYGGSDYWLLCLDLDGNLLWDESYGGESSDSPISILINNDENLILAGYSLSNISGNKNDDVGGLSDYWVLEVSTFDGAILNQKSIGSDDFELFTDIQKDNEGNFYLIGESHGGIGKDKSQPSYGGGDIWIVKIDENFNIIDDNSFGGSASEYFSGAADFHNGHLFVLVDSESPISGNKTSENFGSKDSWLMKIDENLNLIWDKSYGGMGYDSSRDIKVHSTKQIVISIGSDSGISGNKTFDNIGISDDIWLLILSETGEIVLQKVIGGEGDDFGYLALDDFDNIYLSAFSNSEVSFDKTEPSYGSFDYWVLKLNASDYLGIQKSIVDNIPLNVYPNPFSHLLTINFTGLNTTPDKIMIYNINGSLVDELTPTIDSNNIIWNAELFDSGIYTYRIILGGEEVTGKVVKFN